MALSARIHGLLAAPVGAATWFTLPVAAAVSAPHRAFLFRWFASFRPLRALRPSRLRRLRAVPFTGLRGLRWGFLLA
jgi:hypothetical protein